MKSCDAFFRTSCVSLLALLLATPTSAADFGGTLTYKTAAMTRAAAMTSALVTIVNVERKQKIVTRTNELGVFRIRNVSPGVYVVLVEKEGRRLYQGKVEIKEPDTPFNVQL